MNPTGLAIPQPFAALLRRLPEEPPSRLAACALDIALAAGVLQRSAFQALAGRTLRIEASDAGVGVNLTLDPRGFRAARGPADAVIRASALDFLRLALRREDPDTLFFTRRLVIEGDTELGLFVKNALDAVDWDRLPVPLRSLLRLASQLGTARSGRRQNREMPGSSPA